MQTAVYVDTIIMGVPTRYMLLIPHMYTRKQDAETKKVLFCLLYLAEKQEKVKKKNFFKAQGCRFI